MAKSQFPVDGAQGKTWRVSSPFGWRMHPISKVKKHHNGVDITWAGNPYLEACFDGKVVAVIEKNDDKSGGNQVIVQSTVMGKKITWIYMHMVHKSIKVKVGQKITAGTVVGRMGETGFAQGVHVHWEIWVGHLKSQPLAGFATGKGFMDPMAFTKSAIEWEKVHAEGPLETPADAPVTIMPDHSIEAQPVAPKPAVEAPKAVSAPVKPALPGLLSVGSKGPAVKFLQEKLHIDADGIFGEGTKAAVIKFQHSHGLTADGIVGQGTWAKL